MSMLSRSFVATALVALSATAAQAGGVDEIQKAGVLKVCTPGDYKPFSFALPDGSFEGLDVDLVASLASSLGVKPQFVKTSWAKLMDDFTGGACDIAVGGISVTLERQKRAWFSAPYMVNGKTPLVRCADVSRFQSVAAIDQAGVKVVANPGGSNERFARANFKTAQLTIHTDNITIFDEVLSGRADVFVTESAETLVQQKLKPGLCAVNPDKPLQYGEMAYLLPRGDALTKAYVDQWLHLIRAQGDYQRITAKWLN
ncbi:transporter substrate-binding domain-containing protein [Curvibacter sp. RS43]|uniref:Transporter substrate-binding domain-containing protein n=1 Tax=Curvibacter microcysteis TaxID=3026419 RepID=A0ABT5MAF3_9BURK|nr:MULTISPECIES: transporter substrate-binding domain-containing protein [unclassified Curvibacter]MDD0811329.1 transporter substrate-binding domain-containing protein [Curvibacter sp. RS43]MDD0813563.1 transporter substrate-binding domain-containing protein [Curvibacter sp. HBC28]